jgi:ribosomal protein S18 acetylase RimI-like enzyme
MKLIQVSGQNTTIMKTIAACHCAAFPESLTAALGIKFAARMLSWYVATPNGSIYYFEDGNGECAGYCSGIYKDGSMITGAASGMAQHSLWTAIGAFILRPQVIFHRELRQKWPLIWQNIRMRLSLATKIKTDHNLKAEMAASPYVALASIAVHPGHRNKGVGTRLLEAFEHHASARFQVRKVRLSVRQDNVTAIQFYCSRGYSEVEYHGNSTVMEKTW